MHFVLSSPPIHSLEVLVESLSVFLVACKRLCNPLCLSEGSVGWSVSLCICPSIYPSTMRSLLFRHEEAVLPRPKYLVNYFYHRPCPSASDLGSRVSDLVFLLLSPFPFLLSVIPWKRISFTVHSSFFFRRNFPSLHDSDILHEPHYPVPL